MTWASLYESAADEADVQATLARELESYGLVVRREVNLAVPFDGSSARSEGQGRRIDIWAVRPQTGPWSVPIQHRTLGPGGVVGVELKLGADSRMSAWRDVAEQAKSAMRAHDYWLMRDKAKVPLQRPTVVLCADRATLSGKVGPDHEQMAELDRMLWCNGVAILFRSNSGGLRWHMHVGRQDLSIFLPGSLPTPASHPHV